ncbi:alpha/beta fold hydrolase [Saccharothrix syringae]|uniref:Alpha/beta hydrolase n=1 Tax=Saccharothrix syringae TaxID=103733 RepID=A0A5Q0H1Q9_SACSY|nr:alpha/beta hydrolase [Saccharothrix syringae]QFZ20197.1 alpha/beta hydrolase [Saccharothrix syringae]
MSNGGGPHRVRWDGGTRSLEFGDPGADRHGGEPVVVVVPGLGALGYLVDALAGCAAWSRPFLLDVPGFGHRPPRPCAAEVPAVADAVVRWLDLVVGDRPVVLVGHSTGAQAALHVAALHPGRVGALVLMGPTFPPEQRRFPGLLRNYFRNSRREPPGLLPVTVPYYARGGPRELVRFVRSGQRDRPEQVITGVRCPTLLVRGEHDAFSPRDWVDRLTAAAPDGWSETAPGAHTFPYQHGGATSALIARAARRAGLLGPVPSPEPLHTRPKGCSPEV